MRLVTMCSSVPSNYLIRDVNTTLNSESESIIPSHTADVSLGHQLLDNESLIGVWIELSELSTASQHSHSHEKKTKNKVCIKVFFE